MGGAFGLCEDPDMILDISPRFSQRIENQGEFFGVARFGNMLELATKAIEEMHEIRYPDPARLEEGLNFILTGLCSSNPKLQSDADRLAAHLLGSPTDPNILYNYRNLSSKNTYVSLDEAKSMFIDMTARLHGIDYRIAERFLVGREHLRAEVLSFEGQSIVPDYILERFLKRASTPFADIPSHLHQITASLQLLQLDNKDQWYNVASQIMEEFYAQIKVT
jgi:hypothetical protein